MLKGKSKLGSRSGRRRDMSAEENKVIVRRFVEEVGFGKNLDLLDELVSTEFVNHNPLPGAGSDFEGLRQAFMILHSAFPDFHGTIEHLVAEGDLVVFHGTNQGTHQGNLLGISPTDRRVSFSGMVIFRMVEGKIVERWAQLDNLSLLQQLGAIPAAEQSEEASPT
jgi:predicted ester cyclase